ncbi:cytochrome P450 [Streptomyces sp. NPDC048254]|uniref:cytochrome P450 n=1 Tax=Streptomyces sp. NPDC048254 TaxID=3365525 RepID=UPI0037180732
MTSSALPHFPGVRGSGTGCPFSPPAEYADWRATQGLQKVSLWDGRTAWAVTRYEDIRVAMSDPRISADSANPGMPRVHAGQDAGTPLSTTFIRMDDPEHARLRRMVTKNFMVKRVEALRPRIQEVVDDLIEKMTAEPGPADLVQDFALPVPSLVISMLLGVPYEDHEVFQKNSATIISSEATVEETKAAGAALFGYLRELTAAKERDPGDDILSGLITEQVARGELTRDEVASMAMLLLFAGHETTANMIALGTLVLLRHPDQLARVRDTDDPKLIANTVEELLRYLTILENPITRVATEDIVIGGQPVRAGEGLIISLPAGNRDTAFFPDSPDEFDIDRGTLGHLAFGYGIHQCIGQALARVELQVALPTLLRTLPGLRLAVPFEEVPFRKDALVYGLDRLPVAW